MARLAQGIVRILSLCTLMWLASCASSGDTPASSLRTDPLRGGGVDAARVARLNAEQIYAAAREALDSADYTTALQLYDQLDANYPFTAYATQGKLESIYAHYRAFSPELALSAADRFLRAHPRHEHLDYVLYVRGLVNFDRGASDVLDVLNLDSSRRDPINAKRAFEDFARLVQRFPDSLYAADARQRMIYLRDRIAQHELGIARYYEKRRAWVAASRRAQDIIARFQGSQVIPEALDLLARCYEELELADRAEQIRAIRLASYPEQAVADAAPLKFADDQTGPSPAASGDEPTTAPPAMTQDAPAAIEAESESATEPETASESEPPRKPMRPRRR